MSRFKVIAAAAIAALAMVAVTTTASAVPSPCTVTGTSVNCTGTLTGLPPGVTQIALVVDYDCVFAFHREVIARHGLSSGANADVTSEHGAATFNLTATAPTCPSGTVPVPRAATLTLSQGGVVFLVIGPIPL